MAAAGAPTMVTAGIDLAAQPANTAACVIEWRRGGALVTAVTLGLDDGAIAAFADDRFACVGVDCPFGWPVDFVDAVAAHQSGAPWPGQGLNQSGYRQLLKFRRTDAHVTATLGMNPLSASSSLLGVTTMRWAAVMDLIAAGGGVVDRTGRGHFAEVYPAAAMKCWGLPHSGYKGAKNRSGGLAKLVDAVLAETPWLTFADGLERTCRSVDHAFDALIAALVARAVACGRTDGPPPELIDMATREGWIHLPVHAPLGELHF